MGVLTSCPVEDTLGRELSLELDTFLAEPKRWPRAIFDGYQLPPGPLPATMRQWGAVKLAQEWCESRGFKISKTRLARHYREHVPIVPYTPDDFVVQGAKRNDLAPPKPPDNPITFLEYFQKGLAVGYDALERLQKRIDALEADDKPVPERLLMQLASLGAKLAQANAAIVARGSSMGSDREDELEGFRAGTAPLPSERLGHHRVRVVDGVSRPIRDAGPADRADFNERAREDGTTEMPAPR